ncbi:hypothetical protein BH10CHL1_BH10CHL1_06420 [soil metagenome]
MKPNDSALGMTLICDQDGVIRQVLHNDLDLAESAMVGKPFPLLVAPASFQKALSFLVELQSKRTVFDWEFNLPMGNHMILAQCAGLLWEDQLLIIVAQTRFAVHHLFEAMMNINNDQTNLSRTRMKEQVELMRTQPEREIGLYDQLSRMNNELVTLQRELAKKNGELNTANAKLSSLNEQKDRLMGMVAHDLRGPMGNIQMCTELLSSGTLTQTEQGEFIQMMQETSRDALYLINDLLDITAIESGKLVIEPQLVEIAQLVDRISHLNHLIGARKGIQLVVNIDPKLAKVRLDPRRIQQVLDNLLSNAFKYSHPGTTVTLGIEGDGQDLRMVVTDQGQGIPSTELALLFKPFQRTSTRPTGEELSTGLGLSICKRIVELHHGTIGAESMVGRGTTFTICLPESVKQA